VDRVARLWVVPVFIPDVILSQLNSPISEPGSAIIQLRRVIHIYAHIVVMEQIKDATVFLEEVGCGSTVVPPALKLDVAKIWKLPDNGAQIA
jgi:hypothetical protein